MMTIFTLDKFAVSLRNKRIVCSMMPSFFVHGRDQQDLANRGSSSIDLPFCPAARSKKTQSR
ncbi:hypothetical protein [Lactobacillus delbrueckii]|uniref:hypothetical protein n=1 Tax=Lactobacillus delbrueckii TaxID=1584 RepID=UPI002166F394|nr:hypothetical protein [Lactobacillus delbrueckii]